MSTRIPNQHSYNRLHQQLVESFNREEIRELCMTLNVRYEDLVGETLSAEAQSLLEMMHRRNQLPDLLAQLKIDRPLVKWDSYLPAEPEANPPFKGLQYFTEADESIFFGRDGLTAELVAHLNEHRFLAVIGASGSGKSSVVRAGVVPAVGRGEVTWQGQTSKTWPIHIITPGDAPLKALAATLTRDAESVTAMKTVLADMRTDSESLDLWLYRQFGAENTRLFLVIDQFEELFTQCRDLEERRLFVENLAYAVQSNKQGPLTLVITMRADFYAYAVQYEQLRPLLENQQKIMGTMNREELRLAIEGPIEDSGWEFQAGLVNTILTDLGAGENQQPEPGALPLLSHALLETWQRREGYMMTLAGYHESGGVRTAIAKSADRIYEGLNAHEKAIARTIFLRLTELGEGTEDTRRRTALTTLVSQDEETEEVQLVLARLADARLVITDNDIAEVSHEALIREWPRLRDWLNEDREGLRTHRQLSAAAKEWDMHERDGGYLYSGGRLVAAAEWAAMNARELNELEKTFLDASQQAHKDALSRARRRNVILGTALVFAFLFLGLAIIFAIFAQMSTTVAQDNAQEAQYAQETAFASVIELEIALNESQFLREEAEEDERTARSRELANIAELQVSGSPSFALLLALEAYNILSPNDEVPSITESVLHNALQSLQLRRVLSRHTDEVTDVAVNADGSRFATVSLDQTIKLWDTPTGQEIQTIERGHGRPINTVAFHPTQNRLATGGDDGFLVLWDLDRGLSLGVLQHGTNNPVRKITFNPDGSQIAAVTADNLLHLWDSANLRSLEVLEGHEEALTDVAYSVDGQYLATTSEDGSVVIRDVETNTIIQTINPEFADEDGETEFFATAVTFSPNNQTLAAAFGNGIILTWQTGSWSELDTFSGHANRINDIVFSPDSQLLGSASNDNTAKVYNVATAQALFTLSGHAGGITAVAFTPDGSSIITTSRDNTIRLWNDEAGLTPDILTGHRDTIQALAFNADGSRLATGGLGQQVYIWDTATNTNLVQLRNHSGAIRDVVFHPASSNLLATVGDDAQALLWDLNTGKVLDPPMIHGGAVTAVTFNPDGSILITGSNDGLVTFWDTQSHQNLLTLPNESPVRDVAISPDGTMIAVGLENNTAVIWGILWGTQNTGNRQIIRTFAEHEGPVNTVAFNADGQHLATGSEDNTAKVWNVVSGEIVRTLTGHSGPITDIAFHPNPSANRIATASIDGTMKLWNTAGGLVRNFTEHTGAVNRVVFSPDAQTLATVSADRTVRLNELEPVADLFARGLALATRSLTPEECQQYVRIGGCLQIDN